MQEIVKKTPQMAAILKKWQNGKNREASTSNIEEYAFTHIYAKFHAFNTKCTIVSRIRPTSS